MKTTPEQGLHRLKECRQAREEKEGSLNPVLRPKVIQGPC